MSKKILKRSLALGALIAFVITGSAWAVGTLNGNPIQWPINNAISVGSGNLVIDGETISKVYPSAKGVIVIGSDGKANISNATFYSSGKYGKNVIFSDGTNSKLDLNNIIIESSYGNYINVNGSATINVSGENEFNGYDARGIFGGTGGKLTFKKYSETIFTPANSATGSYDISNRGMTITVEQGAKVILKGTGIDTYSTNSHGTVEIAGELNGNIVDNYVLLNGGTWDLNGVATIDGLSGKSTSKPSGALKVDLTKNEFVKVQNNNGTDDYYSKINIDHGGVVGVDIKQGVENFYNTIVDANGKSLIKDKNVGDVFLQATVTNEFGDNGEVTNVTTTIKPGDALVISNGDATNPVDVKVDGNIQASSLNGVDIADLAKVEYVNTELAKKADKSYVDDELAKKADVTYVDTVVSNAVSGKVDQTYVDAEFNKKADKATTLAGYGITDAYTKGEVNAELDKKANQVDVETALDLKADKTELEAEATTREKADIGLQKQINNLSTGSNEAIAGINQRLGKMNGKINKVGAGAAALAALHPLDYDPDDKLTFSAGVGNYAGENAAALGAFYRPDEKFMVSLGGTMGNGENMVNLGISVGLDGVNGTPKLSREELVQKVNAMEAENKSMKAEIAELKALVAELVNKK